jgi:8-hydroxy-5-deazaflavin:NADPH oxidoreductase
MTTPPVGTGPLRIVVVGAGTVGTALGNGFLRLGHRVDHALRPGSERPLPDGAGRVDAGPAALAGADLVVLAVPFPVAADVLRDLAPPAGTVLVDATNPFTVPVPDGYPSGLAWLAGTAGPDVHLVKAFNVMGAEHLADPVLPDGSRPLLPVAADEGPARRLVAGLCRDLGFDVVEVGADGAAVTEQAARYWGLIALAGGRGRSTVLVAHQR